MLKVAGGVGGGGNASGQKPKSIRVLACPVARLRTSGTIRIANIDWLSLTWLSRRFLRNTVATFHRYMTKVN